MTPTRRKMYVRLPSDLTEALERLRFQRSQDGGRRVSLRQLVEELLVTAVAANKRASD